MFPIERVRKRQCFSSREMQKPYLLYTPHKVFPRPTDVTEEDLTNKVSRSIILKNKENGILEEINYVLVGGMPFTRREGYQWYFGEVKTTDGIYSCLCFNFGEEGELKEIHISFCGRSATPKRLEEMSRNAKCAAEAVSNDVFRKLFKKAL